MIQITFAFTHKQNIVHESSSVEFIKAEGQNHNSSARQYKCLRFPRTTMERIDADAEASDAHEPLALQHTFYSTIEK